MSSIHYEKSLSLPVIRTADVIVVGGGPGGIGAAVMAARSGAKTLLVERYGFLGGMASAGEVHPFMPNHVNGISLDKPVYTDWVQAMQRYLPPAMRADDAAEVFSHQARSISKEAAMLAAEDICLKAGVELLYHHTLADVMVEKGAIKALVLHSKSGFGAVVAKTYVDCSGDGDLAVRAGCSFEQGGPSGYCQPMTLCFKLGNVDKSRTPSREELNRLYHEAQNSGEIECPREDVLEFVWLAEDVVHFNTTRIVHRNGADGVDLSEAELEGRRQLRQFLAFFRERVTGYENACIHSIAHHMGIRETRRIKGREMLTRQAFENCAKFPDAIAKVNYPIDIHNPDGSGTEMVKIPAGEWYEIPYGCLVPADCANLLVGGRPISVDHALHSSMRVMPPACSIGQAAGLAAALAAQRGCSPADLDGIEVRRRLVEQQANL
jgi:hypothetical protein